MARKREVYARDKKLRKSSIQPALNPVLVERRRCGRGGSMKEGPELRRKPRSRH